jgi:hypothetical protein
MLPKITEHAQYQFRNLPWDQREEAVQEVAANACLAYARLAERGCTEWATWSSLAKYAVRQFRAGRRVGHSLNLKDVTSPYCQRRAGISVESLTRWNEQEQEWRELIVEDRHQSPADVAAFRLDLGAFLKSLSHRNRKLALLLAQGHATGWVAEKFRLSAARVSQLRREIFEAWQQFQAEPVCA